MCSCKLLDVYKKKCDDSKIFRHFFLEVNLCYVLANMTGGASSSCYNVYLKKKISVLK